MNKSLETNFFLVCWEKFYGFLQKALAQESGGIN